jgi:hypothetical protein
VIILGAYASHRYITSLNDSAHHVRYIGFREREGQSETLGLFSETEDIADSEKFIQSLDCKRLSHPDVPTIHTMLFSMSGDEWERSGFQPGDYQKMIRHVMKEWEIKTGYRLDWVAAEHRNPDHPHCHVAIRAAYKDRDGIEHRLKITNVDRKFFREQFQLTKDLTRGFELPPREFERYKERNFDKQIDTSLLDNLLYRIKQEMEREEQEQELQKKRKKRNRHLER